MLNLNDKNWNAVEVNKLADNVNSKAYHTNNLTFSAKKGLAYITRTARDNGLYGIVKIQDNLVINPANTISFGAETAEFFYQPFPYITGNKMYYMTNSDFNENIGLFLVTSLRKGIKNCFSYANGAIPERVMRKSVMLPVNNDGEPDYEFMDISIKNTRERLIDKYKKYLLARLSKLEIKYIPEINEKEWDHFLISKVFDNIQRGKRLTKANQVPGNTPYVSSTANNNGVDNFIETNKKTRIFSDCISLANSGSVGKAFYEPFNYIASDHVTSLKRSGASKYVYLFLTTMIEQQGLNFNFNREINDERIKKMQIMLPVNENREPDFEYMEQYAKTIIRKKYIEYLHYIKA